MFKYIFLYIYKPYNLHIKLSNSLLFNKKKKKNIENLKKSTKK